LLPQAALLLCAPGRQRRALFVRGFPLRADEFKFSSLLL
jgi:hypothetical protein